ncbi:hypothetical protein KY312_02200 [Candidatus Woesearchaeota archaeon]|nr:hypothetical protein [Candidatus Woesearchaeota archaeon]
MIQKLQEGCIKHVESEYFLRKHNGWKIHLTVKPENHCLVYLHLLHNVPYNSKYGDSDQTGKDFTTYIGSWDDMQHCAEGLEKNIGHVLEPPSGEGLHTDLVVAPKIAARFNVTNFRFHQWGHKGISFLWEDANYMLGKKQGNIEKFKKDYQRDLRKYIERSYNLLNEEYGVYFNGSNQQMKKIIQAFLDGRTEPAWVILKKQGAE